MFGVEDLRAAYHALHDPPPNAAPTSDHPPTRGSLVGVAGVAGGVGTTTVALALAEALHAHHLLELALPRASGLSAATSAELGAVDGWNTGARHTPAGELRIHRNPDASPPPLPTVDDQPTVVDLGVWPIHDTYLDDPGPLVVVAACSIPGARRLEATLQELRDRGTHPEFLPVLVGAPSVTPPKAVRAVFGAQLRAAHTQRRLHLVPEHPALRLHGLTAAPLPAPLQRAAGALARTLEDFHVD